MLDFWIHCFFQVSGFDYFKRGSWHLLQLLWVSSFDIYICFHPHYHIGLSWPHSGFRPGVASLSTPWGLMSDFGLSRSHQGIWPSQSHVIRLFRPYHEFRPSQPYIENCHLRLIQNPVTLALYRVGHPDPIWNSTPWVLIVDFGLL